MSFDKWTCPKCGKTQEVNAVAVYCNGNKGNHPSTAMEKTEPNKEEARG